MSVVLDWHGGDPRGIVRRAVDVLHQGGLVALPTEANYTVAASALLPEAVDRLQTACGDGEAFAVAVAEAGQALDWLPCLGKVGRRLTRRCWPGPMTLLASGGSERGLASRLPESARTRALAAGRLCLRCPAHEAVLEVMSLMPGPLLLAAPGDGQLAVTGERAAHFLGDEVDLLIDAGPCRYVQPTTVVCIQGESWLIVREGIISQADLESLVPCRIVF